MISVAWILWMLRAARQRALDQANRYPASTILFYSFFAKSQPQAI